MTDQYSNTIGDVPNEIAKPSKTYSVFTRRQKCLLICLVSIAATFSGFASNIYFPALPTIASDFNVSDTLINLTVTSYMIFQGLAPSFWGSIADARGRRAAYICTFIVFLAACIALANAQNYITLVILRCLQSAGSASTIALGSGVLGDVTTREERGGYMGIFQCGLLVPVAVGPVIGGAIAGSLGWRAIFWFLAIYSGIFLVVLVAALPETSRSIVGNGSLKPQTWLNRFPLSLYQRYQEMGDNADATPPQPRKIDILAPFRILIAREAFLVIGFLAIYYSVWQMSVTVMSTLFSSAYHLNETTIGLTYIANGVGSMIGTMSTGKLLDIDYRRVQADYEDRQRSPCGSEEQYDKPFPIERARLRLLPAFALIQCAAILVFGWTIHYKVHIAAPIVTTFFTGWTAVSIQSATMTYLVDIFPENSASASAALNLARCLLGALGTAVVGEIIDGIGTGWCFTLLTGIMLLGLGFVGLQALARRRRTNR